VAGQGQQDRALMVRTLAKILRDLTGFDASQGHIDDDAVGVEALGADARLEARGGRLDPKVVGLPEMLAQERLERSIGTDDQDLMINLGFEVAQGHSMLLEESQEMFPRNATILRAGDSITTQAARIEPLAHGPRCDFADLRDLAGCKDFLHLEDSTRPVRCETTEVSSSLRIGTMSAR